MHGTSVSVSPRELCSCLFRGPCFLRDLILIKEKRRRTWRTEEEKQGKEVRRHPCSEKA